MNDFSVSIIIPAYNAAATLADTMASLVSQTIPHWEAIIVDDDGSQDDTAAIAGQFASQDSRIRVAIQTNLGVSAARNTGISLAQFGWLLFLDADDWIAPQYLEKMISVLEADPSLDAVHCGYTRVAPDGTPMGEKYAPNETDLFPQLARYCPFAIHACVFRKTLVEAAGGFDLSFPVCEDWDLWQRIGRTGVHFGAVREVLAFLSNASEFPI